MQLTYLSAVSLVALALVAGALVATAACAWRRRVALHRFLGETMAARLMRSASGPQRRLRAGLLALALAALMLAALRPVGAARPDAAGARRAWHILVLLDCSRSMLARDVAPTRLAHAKGWIAQFADARPTDRLALAVFAGDALLLCPFTTDRTALLHVAEAVDAGAVGAGGTNIEAALRRARALLEPIGPDEGRLLLLISDGEALQGQIEAALPYFVNTGLPIFTVGLGDPVADSVIVLDDGATVRDAAGDVVGTRQNTALLRRLAEATGGRYVHSTEAAAGVAQVAAAIDALPVPVTASAAPDIPRRPERYQTPLLIAVLLLLCGMALERRRTAAHIKAVGTGHAS